MASDRAMDLVVKIIEELEDVLQVTGTVPDCHAAFDRIAELIDEELNWT
jgi:hypothetical protein